MSSSNSLNNVIRLKSRSSFTLHLVSKPNIKARWDVAPPPPREKGFNLPPLSLSDVPCIYTTPFNEESSTVCEDVEKNGSSSFSKI